MGWSRDWLVQAERYTASSRGTSCLTIRLLHPNKLFSLNCGRNMRSRILAISRVIQLCFVQKPSPSLFGDHYPSWLLSWLRATVRIDILYRLLFLWAISMETCFTSRPVLSIFLLEISATVDLSLCISGFISCSWMESGFLSQHVSHLSTYISRLCTLIVARSEYPEYDESSRSTFSMWPHCEDLFEKNRNKSLHKVEWSCQTLTREADLYGLSQWAKSSCPAPSKYNNTIYVLCYAIILYIVFHRQGEVSKYVQGSLSIFGQPYVSGVDLHCLRYRSERRS